MPKLGRELALRAKRPALKKGEDHRRVPAPDSRGRRDGGGPHALRGSFTTSAPACSLSR